LTFIRQLDRIRIGSRRAKKNCIALKVHEGGKSPKVPKLNREFGREKIKRLGVLFVREIAAESLPLSEALSSVVGGCLPGIDLGKGEENTISHINTYQRRKANYGPYGPGMKGGGRVARKC